MLDWLLRRLADDLGVEPAKAGEAITPTLRFERPWPQGVTLLVILGGAALIAYLYWREGKAPPWYKVLLASLRTALLLLAVFMLSEAVLSVERVGLPYFAIVADDSASSDRADQYADPKAGAAAAELAKLAGRDEATRLAIAQGWLARGDGELLAKLSEKHRVKLFLVSRTARELAEVTKPADVPAALEKLKAAEATGTQSLLGAGVRQVLTALRGAPPTAILMLTDGQTTDGETLAQAAEFAARKGVPLFLVGLGDKEPPRDAAIGDLLVDDVVFVDDLVRFEARLSGRGFAGQEVGMRLIELPPGTTDPKLGREVAARREAVPPDGQPRRVELAHRPKTVGDVTYVLEIDTLPREERTDNNRIARTIQVRDDKLKVLLVDGQPRYEYRYLKTFLERRKESIDLRVVLMTADPGYSEQDRSALASFPAAKEGDEGLFQYDVVILGDVDPGLLSATQLENIAEFVADKGGGLLFVAGEEANPLKYKGTPLEALLPVELADARDPTAVGNALQAFRPGLTAEGRSSPIFRFGEDEAQSAAIWRQLPENYWFLEAPRRKPAAFVLAEHPTLAGPEGKLPLIAYQYVGAGKSMFQGVDDTWRWRLRVGDRYFGRYWIQAIRFLARSKLRSNKQAEVETDRASYQRGQPVQVRVRFLAPGLAPSGGEVAVEVERAGQPPSRLALRSSGPGNGVFEGILPGAREGNYTLKLLPPPTLTGALPTATFRVEAPIGEAARPELNEAELARAAATTGGKYYSPFAAATLLNDLPTPQKIPLDTDPPLPLWSDWRLLALFLAIVTTEWVLRKRKQMV